MYILQMCASVISLLIHGTTSSLRCSRVIDLPLDLRYMRERTGTPVKTLNSL